VSGNCSILIGGIGRYAYTSCRRTCAGSPSVKLKLRRLGSSFVLSGIPGPFSCRLTLTYLTDSGAFSGSMRAVKKQHKKGSLVSHGPVNKKRTSSQSRDGFPEKTTGS
jgi:hypothetical protein